MDFRICKKLISFPFNILPINNYRQYVFNILNKNKSIDVYLSWNPYRQRKNQLYKYLIS